MQSLTKIGRPPKLTTDEVQRLQDELNTYINTNDVPILAEFAYQNSIRREDLYNYNEFETLRKKAIDKKESNLERLSLEGKINPAVAIFSLKQLGWRNEPPVPDQNQVIRVEITDDDDK